MITVLIVDDHLAVRAGLTELLRTTDDLHCVGAASDGEQATRMAAELHPDVVLMDLSMPGIDGATATRRLLAQNPGTHVLVLTSFGDQRWIEDAIDAGAEGYLLKHSEPESILAGIRDITRGRSPLDARAARVLIDARRDSKPAATLSAREREVLRRVLEGSPNKTIAQRLDITERTVKAHLTTIYQKLGVTDRQQAIEWAQQQGPL